MSAFAICNWFAEQWRIDWREEFIEPSLNLALGILQEKRLAGKTDRRRAHDYLMSQSNDTPKVILIQPTQTDPSARPARSGAPICGAEQC